MTSATSHSPSLLENREITFFQKHSTLTKSAALVTALLAVISVGVLAAGLVYGGSYYTPIIVAGGVGGALFTSASILAIYLSKPPKQTQAEQQPSKSFSPPPQQTNSSSPTSPVLIPKGITSSKETFAFGFTISKHTLSTTSHTTQDYRDFVLEENCNNAKKALLQATIAKEELEQRDITYYQVSQTKDKFKNLLKLSYPTEKTLFESGEEWFDYTDEGHTYIDFANASHFGGGYRTRGAVQEEMMFMEIPDLSQLHFAAVKEGLNIRPLEGSLFPPEANPTPFIIRDCHRRYRIDKSLYGSQLSKTDVSAIASMVEEVEDSPPVTIAGIAARDWSSAKKPAKYTRKELLYHLQAIFLVCNTEAEHNSHNPVIHTAPWGCGAFKNSEKTMIMLQMLAGAMTGVKMVFHGVGNVHNPNYTEDSLENAQTIINTQKSPEKVLEFILQQQSEFSSTDKSWQPKT